MERPIPTGRTPLRARRTHHRRSPHPAGARVWLSLTSANRDRQQFTNPNIFDSTRTPAHLAYGHGIHYCLGAPLARLEGEIALTSLLRRFPNLTLAVPADELSWIRSFHKRGLQSLPVSW
ncbi:cytochrome P450 [Streptomyces abikoensis]|uniref:cytochrome P450 n=1 Tax=Streptomyces abikoensis TaxID=97398 RepID=UPI0027E538D2|nr:cytochrome P450 [Streptomyces abikoensis]